MVNTSPEAERPGPAGEAGEQSAAPWAETWSSAGTDSVSRALEATIPKLQPRPSRYSPGNISRAGASPASAVMAVAATRTAPANTMDGTRPNRSETQPASGAKANMPAVWADSTQPTSADGVTVLLHVERGHGHDHDHHRLGDHQPRQGQPGAWGRP